ncbi:hypothetical protein F0562_011107 [Nyssa sinensis]|uniref:MULE transposase domain-containing protein n=1 Tax=Nyssa sinensis TaxID=561372 RepID=A0A5J5A3A4_9ASTE|nr:hypothetical protein F0562_011107 [Nyssa sinensis]
MNIIRNVDPDRYSYLNLTEDIGQVSLSHLSSRVGLALTILCDVPRSNDKLLVESDEDILRMFEIHNSRKIKLYVNIMCSSLSQFGDVGMLPATLSLPITSAVHSGTTNCNDNMSNSGDVEDYSEDIYGLSSEDDDLNMNRTNCGENIGKNNSDFTIEHGDGLSNFESNDDIEYDLSIDDSSSSEKGSVGKSKIRDFTIQQGCSIVRDKNEKARVTAHYFSYKWRIHASSLLDRVTYMVKSYNGDHTCVRLHSNPEATSTWIAKKLRETIKMNPAMNLDVMQTYFQRTNGMEASKMHLYRAKMRALDEIEGQHGSSYNMLPKYAVEIKKSNPSDLVNIEYDRPSLIVNQSFKRIFIAFEALINGFKTGCKLFVSIDGCHLKGLYEGVLLAAVSLEENNGLFPIAFGIVESENGDSWTFFLENLSIIIGTHSQHATTTIGYKNGNIKEYCDDAFSKDKYLAAHKHILHPIADPKMWRAKAIVDDTIQGQFVLFSVSRPVFGITFHFVRSCEKSLAMAKSSFKMEHPLGSLLFSHGFYFICNINNLLPFSFGWFYGICVGDIDEPFIYYCGIVD